MYVAYDGRTLLEKLSRLKNRVGYLVSVSFTHFIRFRV